MDIFKVGFIGHKEVENFFNVEQQQIHDNVIKLLDEKEFVEFYIGRNGEFDIMVASVIKGIQRDRGTYNNCLILVLPYDVADMDSYEEYYNEVKTNFHVYKEIIDTIYFRGRVLTASDITTSSSFTNSWGCRDTIPTQYRFIITDTIQVGALTGQGITTYTTTGEYQESQKVI